MMEDILKVAIESGIAVLALIGLGFYIRFSIILHSRERKEWFDAMIKQNKEQNEIQQKHFDKIVDVTDKNTRAYTELSSLIKSIDKRV